MTEASAEERSQTPEELARHKRKADRSGARTLFFDLWHKRRRHRQFAGVAFVFGLAIGSFLNVVIYRVPKGESIVRPGSRCPACGRAVAPRENIPVFSSLWLRGRCAGCGDGDSLKARQ